MSRVLVPIATGSEELEAVTIVDVLRRAGIDVVVAGLQPGLVTASRGVRIQPDLDLDEALRSEYDMVALPGGLPGADHLAGDERLRQLLQRMHGAGKLLGAVCAAPKVLARSGVLEGKRATAYPGVLQAEGHPDISGEAVTRDGTIITSRAAGTALEFALALVEALEGSAAREDVERGLVRN